MSTTAVHPRSPLQRARARLHQSAGTAHACYDDLAAPNWASFRSSRARFLGRPARGERPDAEVAPPNGRDLGA